MLEETGEQMGQDRAYWKTLFPQGMKDLFGFYQESVNTRLINDIRQEDMQSLKVRDRIFKLVQTYIRILNPNKEVIRASLAFYALPQNAIVAPKSLWTLVDIMWKEAGDTSTDYNRYTKRALLSGVVSSTVLFWLNDTSQDNKKTWEFLERRIANVLTVGKKINDVKSFIGEANPLGFFTKRKR